MGPSRVGNGEERIWEQRVLAVCIRVVQRNKKIGYINIDIDIDIDRIDTDIDTDIYRRVLLWEIGSCVYGDRDIPWSASANWRTRKDDGIGLSPKIQELGGVGAMV